MAGKVCEKSSTFGPYGSNKPSPKFQFENGKFKLRSLLYCDAPGFASLRVSQVSIQPIVVDHLANISMRFSGRDCTFLPIVVKSCWITTKNIFW